MENPVKRRRFLHILLLTLVFVSCENVFHNDSLDFMWRLDRIEYSGGTDFEGNVCDGLSTQGLWVSFARDIIEIEDKNTYFSSIGIQTEFGDSIKFDFTMCTNQGALDFELHKFGIPSHISAFCKTTLNKKNMVLTGEKSTLYFTRW